MESLIKDGWKAVEAFDIALGPRGRLVTAEDYSVDLNSKGRRAMSKAIYEFNRVRDKYCERLDSDFPEDLMEVYRELTRRSCNRLMRVGR